MLVTDSYIIYIKYTYSKIRTSCERVLIINNNGWVRSGYVLFSELEKETGNAKSGGSEGGEEGCP